MKKNKYTFKSGFTLIEILIAASILAVFMIAVGTFFLKGNQAAAKGTWRTHTAQQLRMAMKVLQQALDKTAYPTFTSSNDFDELADANDRKIYEITFGDNQILTESSPITFAASTHHGLIFEFATAIPFNLASDKSTTSGGITTKFSFYFPDTDAKDAYRTDIALQTLEYEIEGGNYTYNSGSFSGTNSFSPLLSRRPLLNDVHEITISMLPKPLDTYIHKATIQIDIICRDPFNGQHVVSQSLLHMVNTEIPGS